MALICPACSTENREGANFCKHCGGKLAAGAASIPSSKGPDSRLDREWATTAPAQLRAPAIPGGLFGSGMPAAAMATAGAALPGDEKSIMAALARLRRPASPPREPRARKAPRPRTPRAPRVAAPKPWHARVNWPWLLLLVAALLMIVAGWHGYGTDKPAEEAEAPAPAAAPAAPPPLPEPAMAAVPEPPAPVEMPPPPDATPQGPAATATNLKPPSTAASKPRKPATPAAPQPGASESAPAAAATTPPPSQAAPASADPLALCGDRNFIAKAQCMAAQCAKPEYKPHAQCEAVRRQQRLEEEKRNPTLIN